MAAYQPDNPLIVQGDHTILVEVGQSALHRGARSIVCFAELVKAPEHVHTYRVTPLSIWNACAAGMTAPAITVDPAGLLQVPGPLTHRRGGPRLRLALWTQCPCFATSGVSSLPPTIYR